MSLYDYVKASDNILNKMPGFISIIDTQHKFVWANNKAVLSFGFKSIDDIIGKKYLEVKSKVSARANSIEANEKLVFKLQKTLSFVSYLHYADGWKLAICEKSPIINDNNELIGLTSYWTDITNYALVDISRLMFRTVKEFNDSSNKQFAYRLEDETSNYYLLSERQLECLFFLLRGKTDKNIAKILCLSPRTVESYIQEIKFKMQCLTRTQIIEKSITEGLINSFPISLIQKIHEIVI